MGVGAGIFLIAVGAILAFAVHIVLDGIDLQTVGWILMIVGALGLVVSLIMTSMMSGPRSLRRSSVEQHYNDPAQGEIRRRDTFIN